MRWARAASICGVVAFGRRRFLLRAILFSWVLQQWHSCRLVYRGWSVQRLRQQCFAAAQRCVCDGPRAAMSALVRPYSG